jgi:hypothetical protein
MDQPARVKAHIVVSAILRRAEIAGAAALVVKKGDADAGAIAVKVFLGRVDGAPMARLFLPMRTDDGARAWSEPLEHAAPETEIDALLEKERRFDRDLWIVEIEDREGRSFLAE